MFPTSTTPSDASSRRGWLKRLGGLLAGGALLSKSTAASAHSGQSIASPQSYQPFLAEIMLVSFNFPPKGWAFCNGQVLPINGNQALFALLGTRFGGDGRVNFALPDLRGRIPVHAGPSTAGSENYFVMGQNGGTTGVTVSKAQMLPHAHGTKYSTAVGTTTLSGTSSPLAHHYLADNGGGSPQYGFGVDAAMATFDASNNVVNTSSNVGGSQPHSNMQPYLCLNFVIALQGVFPSRS